MNLFITLLFILDLFNEPTTGLQDLSFSVHKLGRVYRSGT